MIIYVCKYGHVRVSGMLPVYHQSHFHVLKAKVIFLQKTQRANQRKWQQAMTVQELPGSKPVWEEQEAACFE